MISKYHRFMQFTRTASVLDMRGDEETRKIRAARFERKNKTGRKGRSYYRVDGYNQTPRPAVYPYVMGNVVYA